jgi:hypothetical protein
MVNHLKTEHAIDWRMTMQEIEDQFQAGMKERDRYREVLESMHKNITVVKHWAPYIICRDSWLVMIEDALKDDA